MKRVGELYEVVVFTASVSKVGNVDSHLIFVLTICSMATLSLTNLTYIMLSITVSSARVVTTTKVITSRICHKLAVI